jgi:WD40 repeat protein
MSITRILFFTFLSLSLGAQQPNLVLPIGHTSIISSIQFSPDGKKVLSGDGDGVVKLWDINSGMLLGDLTAGADIHVSIDPTFKYAHFSPDGKEIITMLSPDISAKVWDVTSLKITKRFESNQDSGINYIQSIRFCDQKTVIVNFDDETQIRDKDGNVTQIFLTPKEQLLDVDYEHGFAVVLNKALSIVSFPDGKLLNVLTNNAETIEKAVLNKNGNLLAAISYKNEISCWNIKTGKLIGRFKANYQDVSESCFCLKEGLLALPDSLREYIEIWDIATARLRKKIKLSKKIDFGSFLKFNSNGSKLLFISEDGSAHVLDVTKSADLFVLKNDDKNVFEIEFSPDEKRIATAANDIFIWDAATGRLIQILKGYNNSGGPIRYASDGKKLYTAQQSFVRAWTLEMGKVLYRVNAHTENINELQVSNDGTKLLTASDDSTIKVWDTENGKLIQKFSCDSGIFQNVLFSPDANEIFATVYLNGKGQMLDINTGMSTTLISDKRIDSLNSFCFTPDSKSILISGKGPNFGMYDCKDGRLIKEFIGHTYNSFHQGDVLSVAVSEDGKKVYSYAQDHTIKEWDLNSSVSLRTKEMSPISLFTPKVVFNKDCSRVLFFDNWRSASMWDPATGSQVIDFFDSAGGVNSAKFSYDGKYVITDHLDSLIRVWDARTGKRINSFGNNTSRNDYTVISPDDQNITLCNGVGVYQTSNIYSNNHFMFFTIDSSEYFIQIQSGYYLVTPFAAKLLHYVDKDLRIITFEQLDVKYNRPDKVLEAIGNTDTVLIKSYRKAWEKRIKKLGVDTTAFRDGYSVPEADFANRNAIEYEQRNETLILHIKGTDSTYKLDRFNVWVNETPLFGQRGINIRRRNSNLIDTTITIKLSQRENRIETSITNVNGTESYRMPLLVSYIPGKPQKELAYFIGIGIDKFSDSKFNLQYSSKDIRDLSIKLKEKYGSNIIIDTLFNENVTVSNVKALKQKLQQTTVNDKVIIAYSGHGLLSKDFDYYLSTYSINFDKPEENGLSYDELENLLDSIPARKKLMLIDACHSGEVDKEDLVALNSTSDSLIKGIKPVAYKKDGQLGLKNSFELMQSLFVNVGKSTGATIISAAAGTQFALERSDLKNGVFTYSILEAMKDHPQMKISELKTIVGKRVEELTKGLQKPTSRNETIAVDWNVW